MLWKHHDWVTQQTEVRRSRRLVISTIHTVGNYEYGFFWYLYLDGTVQMEVKLTGIVGVSAVESGAERPAGRSAPDSTALTPTIPVSLTSICTVPSKYRYQKNPYS